MATIQSAAIFTRIREVIESSAGALRTVPSARFLGDLQEGMDVTEEMRRALEKPRVHVSLVGMARNEASPPLNGNISILDLNFEIRVVRTFTTLEQISDSSADALMALTLTDADILRQALEYPGNLTQTAAAAATDIVSGLMRYQSSKWRKAGEVNAGAQRLETVHQFSAIAISRPATS